MSTVGRPSEYDPAFLPKVEALAKEGATDREIAEFLGVSERTVYRWQHEHPLFRQTLKLGKEAADERVIKSLYRRAVGYSFDAVKIVADAKTGASTVVPYEEHVPPDTTAAIFWLKNRRADEWRDKSSTELSGPNGQPIATSLEIAFVEAAQAANPVPEET